MESETKHTTNPGVMNSPLYPTLAPMHPNKNQEEKERDCLMPVCTAHFPLTCNPGNIQSIRHGGHYLAPFNASHEARRYLFFLLIYLEGLPTTSPLRRRTLSIPPSIMSISPSPTTQPSALPPTALTTYTTIFISAPPIFPEQAAEHFSSPQAATQRRFLP